MNENSLVLENQVSRIGEVKIIIIFQIMIRQIKITK